MTPEQRIKRLLELIAEQQLVCRDCERTTFIVRYSNGKLANYTEDGFKHVLTCLRSQQRGSYEARLKAEAARA